MSLFFQFALVAVGSSLGGVCRWFVATWVGRLFGTALPIGTFLINVSGSFFLGWFTTFLTARWTPSEHFWLRTDELRLLIAVGFTGAYTTFSTFEFESNSLVSKGESVAGMTYMVVSLMVGLLAVRLGIGLAKP